MWLNISFQDELEVSRCIGRGKFDEAIELMSQGLTNTDRDVAPLEMIALGHHWAGRDDAAISITKKALHFDPKSFGALSLLGQIYAHREEHEAATKYVLLGLENYPEPLPESPAFLIGLFGFICRFVPALRKVRGSVVESLKDPSKPNKEWYQWAKHYLDWYEKTHGRRSGPAIH